VSLQIYDTLSREKRPFVPLQPDQVTMYVCGPTVYSAAHIGHAMSALVFDIIHRYLEYRGYKVRHAMNYTDVDDKIIDRANQQGVDPAALAERYIEEFKGHLRDLNIKPVEVEPRATVEMEHIIAFIQRLIDTGHAYPAEGDVYFRVLSDPDYGKLSHRKLEDMQAGSRIEVDERKEHPMDFALWKAAKPGEPSWESPWGPGRPGWHIECSTMATRHLAEQIDIHGGGNDLIFPHHENEIAQTESLTGKDFANVWIHNGMLQLVGEKMSKSLGNLITIEEFLAQHDPDALRMMVLNASYRSPLAYSEEVVAQAERALDRLRSALRPALPGAQGATDDEVQRLEAQMQTAREGFQVAMDDDFNSAGALACLFDLVRAINSARDAGADAETLERAQSLLRELSGVLGLRLERPAAEGDTGLAAGLIELLIEVRGDLRREKLWSLSDTIRDRLAGLGVVLEDTKEGTTWRLS
jgi:cysteinyl-tRNA synthetase